MNGRLKHFLKTPLRPIVDKPPVFANKPTRITKGGLNLHQSNRAKEGLYHGRDILFGHSISHSHTRSLRKWRPNVQEKRLWSDALDRLIPFKMTTAAMKATDDMGGIDNYILSLTNEDVEKSNYVRKMREVIASNLYHKGLLHNSTIKRLGYDKVPPLVYEPSAADHGNKLLF